jgi:hypothetical protein
VEWLLHDRRPDFIAEGIDCAVRVGEVDDPALVAMRLAEVPRIVVAAPGLWGEGPPPQRPAELATLPWLSLRQFYRDEFELQQQGSGRHERVRIAPRMSTDSLYRPQRGARGRGGGAAVGLAGGGRPGQRPRAAWCPTGGRTAAGAPDLPLCAPVPGAAARVCGLHEARDAGVPACGRPAAAERRPNAGPGLSPRRGRGRPAAPRC